MSPVLISSLRRPPTPATFESTPSDDADMHLRQRAGGDSSDDDTDYDDMPSLESVAGSDEEEAPPSTQPPPRHPNYANMLPTIEETRHREWTMDQFVCFLYRDSAIWLRVSVVMEDTGEDFATPRVEVRFMTRFREDDPALRRIGLIVEHELREGMRREILSAVRQAVRRELDVSSARRICADWYLRWV